MVEGYPLLEVIGGVIGATLKGMYDTGKYVARKVGITRTGTRSFDFGEYDYEYEEEQARENKLHMRAGRAVLKAVTFPVRYIRDWGSISDIKPAN